MTTKTKFVTETFHSVREFGLRMQTVHITPRPHKSFDQSEADAPSQRTDFYGNLTMDQAIAIAMKGGDWQEGAAELTSVELDPDLFINDHVAPSMGTDVAGFAPNVPAYLAGEPESMFTMHMVPQPARLLRVGVHIGRTGHIDQDQIFKRGRAIMSVIDSLENSGVQCELWALWRNEDETPAIERPAANFQIQLKAGDETWTPASVAFALCNAAFQRRLCWRLCESHARLSHMTYTFGNGLKANLEDFDLAFPYVDADLGSQDQWNQYAADIARRALKRNLKSLAA